MLSFFKNVMELIQQGRTDVLRKWFAAYSLKDVIINGPPASLFKPPRGRFICGLHDLCNPEDNHIPSLGETAFLYFFLWFRGGGLPKKISLTYTPNTSPVPTTHTHPSCPHHTQSTGETQKEEIMILTQRGRQCQEMETETSSVPRMHRSEPMHHLYC